MKNIIVTGANKGIGFALVDKLLDQQNWSIIMACRNIILAEKSRQNLIKKYPTAKIELEKLDLSDYQSIESFQHRIKSKYQKIDILVNNAAIQVNDFHEKAFDDTFNTNFYGTIGLTEKLIPFIENKGKIIFMGSSFLKLSQIKSQATQKQLKNQKLSKNQLINVVKDFRKSIQQDTWQKQGWPRSIYGVSKLAINLYTKIVSRELQILQRQIQVYTSCPGYTDTDMTKMMQKSFPGAGSVTKAVQNPMYLINLPFQLNQNFQGKLFSKGKVINV